MNTTGNLNFTNLHFVVYEEDMFNHQNFLVRNFLGSYIAFPPIKKQF